MALTEERVSTFRTNNQDTSGLAVSPQAAEWTVTATSAAADPAAVSQAAVTGKAHYITAIHASFSEAHVDLLIFDAGGERRAYVHNQRELIFESPVKCTDATAFVASLGVTSFVGALTVHGYTA